MIKVCISGARGRMGQMLVELVSTADDLVLSGAHEGAEHQELGLDLGGGVLLVEDLEIALRGADVLLDFSLPIAVIEHAQKAVESKCPMVTGATGLDDAQMKTLESVAEKIPLVWGSNMSRGVFVLTRLVRQAAAELDSGLYDAEIVESHHKHKVDSPSGTANQLAEAISGVRGGDLVYGREGKRSANDIGLSAVRGGDVVGEHQVMFLGLGEQIILQHRATTREHFCQGALAAVRFVLGKAPGFYGMSDVFDAEG